MRETLHSQNLVHIAEEMQLGNNAILRSVKVRTDTKMNIMRTEALSGHGLNVTGAAGQQKPIATNTSQRITGTRARQKGEPMAKKYIDADKLLRPEILHLYYHLPNGDIAIPLIDIEHAPTIEPERKTGKWIHDGYDFPHGVDWIHCSVCGKCGINVPADLTNFCPNCGADMRGEGE